MAKTRIWLHIGSPKTGTTAFQSFCSENRDKLLREGILYPQTGRIGVAHHELAWAITRVGPEVNANIYQKLIAEIEASTASDVLISSEVFFITPDCELLSSLLSRYDVKIIAFLRHQLVWYPAMYQQYIKENEYRLSKNIADADIMDVPRNHLNYFEQMNLWETAFGTGSVVAVPYHELATLKKFEDASNDTLTNIFQLMKRDGVSAWPRPSDVGQINISLNNDELELVRLSNGMESEAEDRSRFLYAMQKTASRRRAAEKSPPIYWLDENMIRQIIHDPCRRNDDLTRFTQSSSDVFFLDHPELDEDQLASIKTEMTHESLSEIGASLFLESVNYANYRFGFNPLIANEILHHVQLSNYVLPFLVLFGSKTFKKQKIESALETACLTFCSSKDLMVQTQDGKFQVCYDEEVFTSCNMAIWHILEYQKVAPENRLIILSDGKHFCQNISSSLNAKIEDGEIMVYNTDDGPVCAIMSLDDFLNYSGVLSSTRGLKGAIRELSSGLRVVNVDNGLDNWVNINDSIRVNALDILKK